jgi:hypothetical protein
MMVTAKTRKPDAVPGERLAEFGSHASEFPSAEFNAGSARAGVKSPHPERIEGGVDGIH